MDIVKQGVGKDFNFDYGVDRVAEPLGTCRK